MQRLVVVLPTLQFPESSQVVLQKTAEMVSNYTLYICCAKRLLNPAEVKP